MPKPKLTAEDVCRLHDLHRLGLSNVDIGAELGVTERTIRYHLAKVNENDTKEPFSSLSVPEKVRKDSLVDIIDKQISILSKKLIEADEIKITKPSEFLKASQALTDAIALRNNLSANAKPGASSALEKLDISKLKSLKEIPENVRRKLIRELKSGI